jgi:hypothetical protein
MDDRSFVEVIHGGHDAVLEFLFGCDADVAQDGAGELGEEALDQVQPGAVLGGEGEVVWWPATSMVPMPTLRCTTGLIIWQVAEVFAVAWCGQASRC